MRIFYDNQPWVHPAQPGHPERPHRIAAAYSGMLDLPKDKLSWHTIAPIPLEQAILAHDEAYLDKLRTIDLGSASHVMLDSDTAFSATSLQAALSGLGGARAAVDDLMAGHSKSATLISRPPGHHACKANAMGFCLFGTAAWAALDAKNRYGARVAVLDFDLHHGNGTQDILWEEPDVFFASSHQDGLYPGTGKVFDVGKFSHIYNAPLAPGSGSAEMREAWALILKEVSDFAPDLIIVSAGFDAHANDPMSSLDWSLSDYEWLGTSIADLASKTCDGRVLSILEGGYDLQVIKGAIKAYSLPLCMLDKSETFITAPENSFECWSSPYLTASLQGSADYADRYAVRKMNGRLWIEDQHTQTPLWTPPDFIKMQSRQPLFDVVLQANQGGIKIESIIDLEASARRNFGFNGRRSTDFLS
jgi:acetoin utilization deacetylase AcuC-like enzyme